MKFLLRVPADLPRNEYNPAGAYGNAVAVTDRRRPSRRQQDFHCSVDQSV
jgi:hypothetical protein